MAIDLNENEEVLIEKALHIGMCFNSKVWLVHIAAPDPDFIGHGVGPQYIRDTRAEELRTEHKQLQEYADYLERNGLNAEGLLVAGATIEMVIKEAQKLEADMIIVGHEEHGFFYKALTGSISAGIIKRSKIPVLVVPIG